MVKKRMSCLMGCQECNSIIMKSDSGELAGWMDGWLGRPLRVAGRLPVPPHMPEHPQPPGPAEAGEQICLSLVQP